MAVKLKVLGRTGVQVSELCLGCMMFGGKTDLEDTCRIIDVALERGVQFFDTADVYSRGRSEEFTGEALKRNGKRDRVVLASKVHGRMNDDDPNAAGNSRRHIIAACEASLKRLQTDYLDIYQIHRPDSKVPIDETLRALDDLVRSGKVRYVGTSTYAAWKLVESLWTSKELGLNRFVTEQPPYNLLDRRIERELLPMAQTYGFGLLPWSPLAGGLLTGKYRRGQQPPAESRFANVESTPHLKNRYHEGIFNVVDVLETIAQKHSATISQVAIAWVLAQPAIASPIIGPRTVAQLEDNLAAVDVVLDARDLADLDVASPPGGMISPFFESDFSPNLHRL